MATQNVPFKDIRFIGGRFHEAAGFLDVDVVSELQYYRKLVVTIAGEQWRRQNPERERLPRGFSEDFHLGFGEIVPGSCLVPLKRVSQESLIHADDNFDLAASAIDETLLAIRDNRPFPDGLTTSALPMFQGWCRTLRPEESLVLGGAHNQQPIFNDVIRQRLLDRMPNQESYVYELDLSGEVRAADLGDLNNGSFRIRTEDGDSVPGTFNRDQESSITAALHNHSRLRLKLRGLARFSYLGEPQRILQVDYLEVTPIDDNLVERTSPPLLEMFDEIHRSMPEDALEALPSDGAENYKHYIYGWSREN